MSTDSLSRAVSMPRAFAHKSEHCSVSAQFGTTGAVTRVRIELSGPLSRVPSTSNSKAIRMTRYGRPFVAKSDDHIRRLAAMTSAYTDILTTHSIYPGFLTFGREKTLVVVQLSSLCDGCDTHNMSKPICDWLQSILILENDKFADCLCLRSEETLCDPAVTRIDVVRAAAVRTPLLNFLRAIGL